MTYLYFTADWCVPCKTFGPMLDFLREELGIAVVKVDINTEFDLTRRYEVRSIPTLIAVTTDGAEVRRFSGARDYAFTKSFIASVTP